MPDLKSVSNPKAAEAAMEMAQPAAHAVAEGAGGSADSQLSRAARAFIRTGKSEQPLRSAPGAGIPGLETVIGQDERTRIVETDLLPWRMICALRLIGTTGSAIGTGWLAGPRTIVTAGHCVHHLPFFGGWVQRIEVSAGRDDDRFPFGTVTATRFSALDKWVESADPDFDIGCIHLDEPLGDKTGFFSFATMSPEELTTHFVNISGYPADRGNGEQQFFHFNRVLSVGPRRVFYDVDTFGGQSGAPVWIQEEVDGPPTVVGVHAYGTGGTPFNLGITANSAPRIIPEVFEIINGWLKEDEAPAGDGS